MSQNNPGKSSTEGLPEGYVNFRGQVVTQGDKDYFDQIYNWNVREKDVWICTFPKSGTTWAQEMIWMIMNDLDFEKGKAHLYERSPFLELSLGNSARFLNSIDPNNEPYLLNSLQYAKEKSGKEEAVLLKTHLGWNLLPKEIQDGTMYPKIVYVARNPKDCCVSYYHHSRILWGHSKSLEEFSESFLAGKHTTTPYWNHVLPFWERRHQPNILFIRYEDMIKDLPAVIKQVATFLDKPLKDDQVDILSDHLSFSNMKNNPAVNNENFLETARKSHSNEGSFMRKGKAGSYKEDMSEEMIRKFDEWIERNIKGTDYVV